MLTFVTALFVCIGFVAAVEFTAGNLSYEWFGIDWRSDTRSFLIDSVGLSTEFVCGYISFAMIDVPAWVCYTIVASGLGLIRSKRGLITGLALITSICLWDFTSDHFSGLQSNVNLRLVSLFGVAITAMSFFITRKLRGRLNEPTDRKPNRLLVGIGALTLVASLIVSAYGWWLVDLNRKAGLQVQEMFDGTALDPTPNEN